MLPALNFEPLLAGKGKERPTKAYGAGPRKRSTKGSPVLLGSLEAS
jgi:hypothetical protein